MKFNSKVQGKVMEVKPTKKGEPFAILYSDGQLMNVFKIPQDFSQYIGKDVSIEVEVMTKEAYIVKK